VPDQDLQAEFLTTQGYNHCYNLSEGFEGGHDSSSHRGKVNGWKFSGLTMEARLIV
jgi:rhodanese-related sulfurtransferase